MSIPVDLSDLERTLADFGAGYLLTSADGRVKAVTVEPYVAGGLVVVPGQSRGSADNLAVNPAATLLMPPRESRGYTLLVDGTAEPADDGFRLVPASAVLHRPAAHADPAEGAGGDSACGHDCTPVGRS
jgi:hypothetical protein